MSSIAHILILVCLFTASFISPLQVSAHMLKRDDSIGAVIHVDPDDDPIAGQPSSLYFELKDTSGEFSPQSCECVVRIKKAGEVLSTFPLYQSTTTTDLNHAAATYTFPEKGVYTIELSGTPLENGMFSPFTLSYDMRVQRMSTQPVENQAQPLTEEKKLVILLGSIGCCIVLILIFLSLHGKKAQQRSTKKL